MYLLKLIGVNFKFIKFRVKIKKKNLVKIVFLIIEFNIVFNVK